VKAGKSLVNDIMLKIGETRRVAIANGRAPVSAISLRHIIWLPHESHAGISLPSVLRLQVFGYVKRV